MASGLVTAICFAYRQLSGGKQAVFGAAGGPRSIRRVAEKAEENA